MARVGWSQPIVAWHAGRLSAAWWCCKADMNIWVQPKRYGLNEGYYGLQQLLTGNAATAGLVIQQQVYKSAADPANSTAGTAAAAVIKQQQLCNTADKVKQFLNRLLVQHFWQL